MFQFDLASNPAVTQLASDAQHANLHRLLTIFLGGTMEVCGWARVEGCVGVGTSLFREAVVRANPWQQE
jgi:hypothetical protein